MRYTFKHNYLAHTVNGKTVMLPDMVAGDQKAFDGKRFTGRCSAGIVPIRMTLRGDLYGLHSTGTGDPVVSLG